MSEDGWHDDPYGRTTKRYFDGAQWTEHVVSAGVQTTDPLPGHAQVLPAVDNPSQHANLGRSRPLAGTALRAPAVDNQSQHAILGPSPAAPPPPHAAAGVPHPEATQKAEILRWEYLVDTFTISERIGKKSQNNEMDQFRSALNTAGRDGWEMISYEAVPLIGPISGQVKSYAYLCFFKRPIA